MKEPVTFTEAIEQPEVKAVLKTVNDLAQKYMKRSQELQKEVDSLKEKLSDYENSAYYRED